MDDPYVTISETHVGVAAGTEYRAGLYTPEMTERVYRELLDRAGSSLSRGESVVLDASWTRESDRRHARGRGHGQRLCCPGVRCFGRGHCEAASYPRPDTLRREPGRGPRDGRGRRTVA